MDSRDVILGAIGSALIALATWIAPTIKRSIDAFPTMMEAQREIAVSLAIMSRVCAAMQVAHKNEKTVMLLIEDAAFDAAFVQRLCRPLRKRHNLTMMVVTSLEESYRHLADTCVVILDVILPDSTIPKINAFIDHVHPPVIVYSANEYPVGTFKNAAGVAKKWDDADALVEMIERVIQTHREDCDEC